MLQLISCILDRVVTTNFLTVIMGHPVPFPDELSAIAIVWLGDIHLHHEGGVAKAADRTHL